MKNSRALNRAGRWLKHNAPIFLSVAGAAGLIATAYLTAKETPEAKKVYDEGKEDAKTVMDKVCLTADVAKEYWPAIAVGSASIFCIIGSTILSRKQEASLAGAYVLLEKSYQDYKKKVRDLYGKDADETICKEMSNDHVDKNETLTQSEGKLTFYEDYYGNYFESTAEEVLRAELEINEMLQEVGEVPLEAFYKIIGLTPPDNTKGLGWSVDTIQDWADAMWIYVQYDVVEMADGMECNTITFAVPPTDTYLDEWQ